MNKTSLKVMLAVAGVSALAFSANQVLAYQGDPSQFGPNHTEERHAAMTQAFEQRDFQAWKEMMQDKGRVSEIIDESNFEKFAQMHQYRLEGNNEEADKIRAELGLGQGSMAGRKGESRGRGRYALNQ